MFKLKMSSVDKTQDIIYLGSICLITSLSSSSASFSIDLWITVSIAALCTMLPCPPYYRKLKGTKL